MHVDVITLFPEIFHAYLNEGIMKRAMEKGILKAGVHNLRDFALDRHRTVDDYPYGGGPGMVIKADVVSEAVGRVKSDGLETLTVLLSPQGRRFDQRTALRYSKEARRLLLLCGRYEGFDDRVRQSLVDEEVSAGDFVLTGGELPALIVMDSAARLVPGALGDELSLREESFSWGILDYPQFTRPPVWMGLGVPEVLLSGNHGEIARWRRKEALKRTLRMRPDLMEGASLSERDNELISEIKEEDERWT